MVLGGTEPTSLPNQHTHASTLHSRLAVVVEDRPFAEIAERTRLPRETVRRYLLGGEPSVEFIVALCTRFGIRAHWLLTGEGPMHTESTVAYSLAHASPRELLSALARHMADRPNSELRGIAEATDAA